MIYLIATVDRTACKIGVTSNLDGRLSSLRNGNHMELELIATRDGSFPLEQAIHFRLADRRLRGEWFTFDDGIISTFNDDFDVCEIERAICADNSIKATRKALGLTQAELGFKLGITGATVSRLESGEIVPSVRDILAMEALVARLERDRAA